MFGAPHRAPALAATLAAVMMIASCRCGEPASDPDPEPAEQPEEPAAPAQSEDRGSEPERASMYAVGEPAPDVAFPSIEGGEPLSLADFRGEKVLLLVFASW